MEEKRANEYDYNSRDYVVVEEGTEGSRTEQGGWHYEPRDYDYGSSYGSRGSYYGDDDYDSNRYYMEEKRANEYDYNSRDYVVVEEGTVGSRTEQGGWHYEPRDYDYGSSYGSRGSHYGDDYGRGSNYGDRRGRGGGDVHHHHHHSDGYRGSH